jgi:hypothetical protein
MNFIPCNIPQDHKQQQEHSYENKTVNTVSVSLCHQQTHTFDPNLNILTCSLLAHWLHAIREKYFTIILLPQILWGTFIVHLISGTHNVIFNTEIMKMKFSPVSK